jgi:hypothetical protein
VRDGWFGDNRDLVKWSTLVHLAKRETLQRIVQVAYFRESPRPKLITGAGPLDLDGKIWTFFRDLRSVERLSAEINCTITVLDEPFSNASRGGYLNRAAGMIKSIEERKVVLLDPDTGLAPARTTSGHVTVADVILIWVVLKPGDWLLLYQHRWRSQNWQEEAVQNFGKLCKGSVVEKFSAPEIAPDAVLLGARKQEDC